MNRKFSKPTKESESEEQQKLFQWASIAAKLLDLDGLELMFHVPNEGLRSLSMGRKMKAEGLKKGVADICLPVPRGQYHGLFFEMKAKDGKLTKEQIDFLKGVKKQGYATWVCYSAEEAINLITKYYELPCTQPKE